MKKVKMSQLNQKEKMNALNEIRILASIDSPYVIKYRESFYDENSGFLCIVMEYADKGDLQGKINQMKKKNQYFEESQIWDYASQLLMGLKALHQLNILHRDLKGANVFLSEDGKKLKLGDLNVSKVAKSYAQT